MNDDDDQEPMGIRIIKQGFLKKKGHVMPTLKGRFFVLTPTKLQYFTAVDGKLKGEVRPSVLLFRQHCADEVDI